MHVFKIKIVINSCQHPKVGLIKGKQRPALEGGLCSMPPTT